MCPHPKPPKGRREITPRSRDRTPRGKLRDHTHRVPIFVNTENVHIKARILKNYSRVLILVIIGVQIRGGFSCLL